MEKYLGEDDFIDKVDNIKGMDDDEFDSLLHDF